MSCIVLSGLHVVREKKTKHRTQAEENCMSHGIANQGFIWTGMSPPTHLQPPPLPPPHNIHWAWLIRDGERKSKVGRPHLWQWDGVKRERESVASVTSLQILQTIECMCKSQTAGSRDQLGPSNARVTNLYVDDPYHTQTACTVNFACPRPSWERSLVLHGVEYWYR